VQELTRDRIPLFLTRNVPPSIAPEFKGRGLKVPALEKGIRHVAGMIKTNYAQWESASKKGLFQKTDPRIKILFLVFFIIIVSLKREVESEVLIGMLIFILAWLSRLEIYSFYKRIFVLGFLFGFLVSLPSSFNLVAKGEIIFPLLSFSGPYEFWIYRIPADIGITKEGLYGVAMLTLRVMNSVSLVFLVLHTTSFADIMKTLKIMKIPDALLITASLSYKYFFLFARTVEDMHLAKKSRQIRESRPAEARRWVAGRIAMIFGKTQKRSEEIFRAMLSRGFSNAVQIYGFKKLRGWDLGIGLALCSAGVLLLWI